MDYAITRVTDTPGDELKHYGVLGMKWGVRRATKKMASATNTHDRKKAALSLQSNMTKASKKLNKLDKKTAKKQLKAEKKYMKYSKQAGRGFLLYRESKMRKAQRKFKRADAKYANSIAKASKWYDTMEDTFKGTGISTTKQQQALGRKYIETMEYRLRRSGFDR